MDVAVREWVECKRNTLFLSPILEDPVTHSLGLLSFGTHDTPLKFVSCK